MKNPRILVLVVGVVLIAGLCVIIAKTPNGTDSVAAKSDAAAPAADTAKAAKCAQGLQSLGKKTGLWRHYEMRDGIGTVEIGDIYYAITFDEKAELNAMMLCVFTEGRENAAVDVGVTAVEYLDSHTHKTVATWTPMSGLTVE